MKKGRTFLTGDIHGGTSIGKLRPSNWEIGASLCKNDYVIVLGDFGLLWGNYRTKEETFLLEWLDDCPWTTLFIDGNHENHYLLNRLQEKILFGSPVGILSHSVFHLKRGTCYFINRQKLLTIGGADSIDKDMRTPGRSWWEEETITDADITKAKESIAKVDGEVDYILTHAAPTPWARTCIYSQWDDFFPSRSDEQLEFLRVSSEVKFKRWFFGHYHTESEDQYQGLWHNLFHKIIEIT